MTNTKMMTVPEAAKYLRIAEVTVWKWLAAGRMTRYKLGVLTRVSVAELDGLLQPAQVSA